MTERRVAEVTDTRFEWLEPGVIFPDPLRLALCGWVEAHGLDPRRIPTDEPILRDPATCQVRCTYYVVDDGGEYVVVDGVRLRGPRVAQGETPPLPWPDVVAAAGSMLVEDIEP